MRIATWNIGGGFISVDDKLKFDSENINYFIDELKKITPDVVCFQEIHVSEHNDQPRIIAEALGFEFWKTESVAESHLKAGEKLSISIISKYPIKSSRFYKLPNPDLQMITDGITWHSHDKGFLETVIDYNGVDVRILSGHMVPFRKFGADFLADEFKIIRDEIEKIICDSELPTIVGADMNFEDIYHLIPRVFKQGFKFVLADTATTPKGRKYDKILISKDWTSTGSQVIQGQADHYLCFANIEMK